MKTFTKPELKKLIKSIATDNRHLEENKENMKLYIKGIKKDHKNEIENYKQTIQNREFKLVDAADKYAELEQDYESMYNKRNIEIDKLAASKESASYWHDEWLALSEEIAVLQDK